MVMWILILLSIFCLSIGFSVRQRIMAVKWLEARSELRRIADSAVRKAVCIVDSKKQDKLFFYDWLGDEWARNEPAFKEGKLGRGSFSIFSQVRNSSGTRTEIRYGLVDEESKININLEKQPFVLTRLIQTAANVKQEEAADIAASIIDWKDEDDFVTTGGAESSYYRSLKPPRIPKNKDFEILEELMMVKGMTPEIYERLFPYVTLENEGKINLNTVSKVVLRALGMDDLMIGSVLQYRAGLDHVEGTKDDQMFKTIASVAGDLGLTEEPYRTNFQSYIEANFRVASQHFSIHAVARLEQQKQTLVVDCVAERYGPISRWRERFVVS